jgi:hypothetical protein
MRKNKTAFRDRVTGRNGTVFLALSFLPVATSAFLFSNRAHSAAAPVSPTARLSEPRASIKSAVVQQYGELPLSFEINEGQVDKQVKYLAYGPGYGLGLTRNGALLMLAQHAAPAPANTTVNPPRV